MTHDCRKKLFWFERLLKKTRPSESCRLVNICDGVTPALDIGHIITENKTNNQWTENAGATSRVITGNVSFGLWDKKTLCPQYIFG